MKGIEFRILFDYVKKTDSAFLMPKIVYEELIELYKREVSERIHAHRRSVEKLQAILVDGWSEVSEWQLDRMIADYSDYILRRLEIDSAEITEFSEKGMRDAISRAVERRRPCTDKGEEIRDAILWNSILEYADELALEPIAFISSNILQFADSDKTSLHPDLMKEVAAINKFGLRYYRSLGDFAAAHASKIEFITKEWIEGQLTPRQVLEADLENLKQVGEHNAYQKLRMYLNTNVPRITDYFEIRSNGVNLEEYYVYEMADGTQQIQATYYGDVEMGMEYDGLESDSIDSRAGAALGIVRNESTGRIYVTEHVEVTVGITVVNGEISGWKVL